MITWNKVKKSNLFILLLSPYLRAQTTFSKAIIFVFFFIELDGVSAMMQTIRLLSFSIDIDKKLIN